MAASVVATNRMSKSRSLHNTNINLDDFASVLPPPKQRKLDVELGLLLHGYEKLALQTCSKIFKIRRTRATFSRFLISFNDPFGQEI
jgi:hypothetical protein